MTSRVRHLSLALLASATLLAGASTSRRALADVRLEGEWGSADHAVTLDLSATPRARAIQLLAEAAGFSVVMSRPPTDVVDVHVRDQKASDVLGLLLDNGAYIARRKGSLVSIQAVEVPAAIDSPATAPSPGANPRGEDRTVFGSALTLGKGEVAHDVAVFGGSLDVYGTVTGELAVLGGAAHVHDGGKVLGSATVLGGELRVDDGAEVAHDVSVVAGHLDRAPHATVHVVDADESDDDVARRLEHDERDVPMAARARRALLHWGDDAMTSLSRSTLLFAFGAVFIALATDRSRKLRVEVAARPMRTLALGVVGSLVACAVAVALCITLVGIPVAMLGAVLFLVAACAGVAAVLTTAGEALLRHRTTNVYVHLAVGCGLYFGVSLIPVVGSWAVLAVILAGIGSMVATRGAGLVARRGPYELHGDVMG